MPFIPLKLITSLSIFKGQIEKEFQAEPSKSFNKHHLT